MRFYVGLDLGQRQDFTALVVVEAVGGQPRPQYHVRHAERAPLGTSYSAVAAWVRERLTQPPVRGRTTLIVDETGVGVGVTELLRHARVGAPLVPCSITAGQAVTQDANRWRVAKAVLVSTVDALLDADRLRVAAALTETPVLVEELHAFQRSYTAAANEVFGAVGWRDQAHDDYVLAIALACWYGETHRPRVYRSAVGGVRQSWHLRPGWPFEPLPGPGSQNRCWRDTPLG